MDHNKLWKILEEMGIPDHLTCLLRNLYAGQEATVRTGHRTTDWFQNWGIYAYRRETLAKFVSLPEGRLERCEKLEQLRALENGIRIKVIKTSFDSIGIDTPDDLVRAQEFLARRAKNI